VSVSVSGDHTVDVATHGTEALLVTDDGRSGQVWLTHVPSPSS
jgi:glucose/arabinose dehydrogenase